MQGIVQISDGFYHCILASLRPTQDDAVEREDRVTQMREAISAFHDKIAAIVALPARGDDTLRTAALALIAKLELSRPHTENAGIQAFVVSGLQRTGPQYGEEMDSLRRALDPAAIVKEAGGESS